MNLFFSSDVANKCSSDFANKCLRNFFFVYRIIYFDLLSFSITTCGTAVIRLHSTQFLYCIKYTLHFVTSPCRKKWYNAREYIIFRLPHQKKYVYLWYLIH